MSNDGVVPAVEKDNKIQKKHEKNYFNKEKQR